MHIILAFPFQSLKQQSQATLEGNSALLTPRARQRAPCSWEVCGGNNTRRHELHSELPHPNLPPLAAPVGTPVSVTVDIFKSVKDNKWKKACPRITRDRLYYRVNYFLMARSHRVIFYLFAGYPACT
jgi:hypothetical protein